MSFIDSVVKKVTESAKKSSSGSSSSSSSSGGTYKVGSDGKAPSGLSVGDSVVTGGGTYKITGVNSDGSYKSELSNANQTTSNYSGSYSSVGNAGDWIGSRKDSVVAKEENPYGTYEDDLNRLTEAQKQAQIASLKQAKEKALANLDVQEQAIKPMYQNQRNMASASSQQGARSFAEYLANRGLTNSGASAQGEINRLSTLQNTMGQIGTAEANAYRDIANQRTAIENDYVTGLANANAQIDANYYANLLNYNQAQRDKVEALQEQALYQYADDYQARINELLAQGYSPNSIEILTLQALRGNKMNNYNTNAYTPEQSKQKIYNATSSSDYSYNDVLAAGFTSFEQSERARKEYQEQMRAQAEAEAQQQELENYIALQKLQNDTAQTNYNINKPYYKPGSGGNGGNNELSYSQVNSAVKAMLSEIASKSEATGEKNTIRQNAAKYLISNLDSEAEIANIANQNGLSVEQMARAMWDAGYDEASISSMAKSMMGQSISDNYMQAILDYARGDG